MTSRDLSYLRDRLVVARDLLTESGSVFVQIGDENVHLVRSLLDEVFGAGNFVSQIAFRKTAGLGSDLMPAITDYIVWYSRNRDSTKVRRLFSQKGMDGDDAYSLIDIPGSGIRRMTNAERTGGDALPAGARILRYQIVLAAGRTESCIFPIELNGRSFEPTAGRSWSSNREGMGRLITAGRIAPTGTTLSYLRYLDDFPVNPIPNLWNDTASGSGMDKVYVVQSSTKIVERCLLMTTDPGDLLVDPTCGSGTTAYVAENWGRRWITIDTSRVALTLARSRLMAAKYPYYLLADSEAGIRKEADVTGQFPPDPVPPTASDVRRGFVYERVPHVTLRSIAQNSDIHEDMTREEIDRAIARHADNEVLFDRPYQDAKVVRVSGPFTVESLSPHRVLVDGPEDVAATEPPLRQDAGRFVTTILDNLRRAGVQNTKRNERLVFTRLDPYPGVFVQGFGEYVEAGATKNVAIAIGPEFGTVGPELIRDATKEAVKVADLLVVCGFAFDPLAGEEASSLGRLTILQARMNPDLAMGDELLKKTGSGNLFMVFGEPDIDVRPVAGDKVTVEVRGIDVYDPTTGALRSSSVDDIACWFLDTNYDGESFFIRHAYFVGADDPYEKLRRALRADISDEAWDTLNRYISRPFPRPKTGKVAVKVINHYGDEVMKVLAL